ncbi:MAG: hypothetical protein ACK4N4_10480 [Burkholderiales bacterium]
MSNLLEVKIGSTIYDHINVSRMSEAERLVAINAMRDAELLVDAWVWVSNRVGQLVQWLSLKPSLKH